MDTKINILHLEDSLRDSELIRSIMDGGGIVYEYFLAENKKEFINILDTENINLILSDYSMPGYNGNEALNFVKEKHPSIPFIFVSGTIGEDSAINALTNGATDYVLKHKLERLIPAIKRAIYEIKLEIQQKLAEDALKESMEMLQKARKLAQLGVWNWKAEGDVVAWTEELYEIAGIDPTFPAPSFDELSIIYSPKSWQILQTAIEKAKKNGNPYQLELEIIRSDGNIRNVIAFGGSKFDNKKQVIGLYGTVQDITERKRAEQEIILANKELHFQIEEKEKQAAELSKSKQFLSDTGKLAKVGGWEISALNKELYWSDELYQIHEVGQEYQPTLESAINSYVPESRHILSEALDNALTKGKPFDLDLELVTAKQHKIWVRLIGHAYQINGEIVKISGMLQDITERKLAEEVLVKMKKAINASGEAIFLTDIQGCFTYINPAFTSLYGFTEEEIIGKFTPNILKSGVLDKSVYELFWGNLLNGNEVRGEIINKKKDGTLIDIESSSTPIFDEENRIIGFLGIQRDITERKHAEEALKNSQQQLRNFASHLQNIREEEKIAIAREIHDDLGQILVALKIDIGLFKQKISKENGCINSEEIMGKFDYLSGMVDKTIKTARRIMTGLRPEIIDSLGFIEAAKSYVLEFEERHRIPCQFNCTILNLNITPQQSVALFRILQEALTNVAKHAKASAVKIKVSIHTHKLILEITDNGIGFHENHTLRQDSFGMLGMKERVILLDSELFITGNKGKGTTVRVEVPYKG